MENNLKKIIGLNIAKYRIKKGISEYELSMRLGKDATYINKIENGLRFSSIPMLYQICEVLEITPNDLFDYKK